MTSLATRVACTIGILGVVAAAASCQAPTEVTVEIATNLACTDVGGTAITVGHLDDLANKAFTITTQNCRDRRIGTIVISPSDAKDDVVSFSVVISVKQAIETCLHTDRKGCIVARRSIKYSPNQNLHVYVPMRTECDGVPCGPTQTCVVGACRSATIVDTAACTSALGCKEDALGP